MATEGSVPVEIAAPIVVPRHGAVPARYITDGLAGIGGFIKQRPEDFLVDEQPQYQPCGSGEHIYMLVQKRLMSTLDMVSVIARHFGVARGAVGYAGLKDKHAITRQVVSVHAPGKRPEDFPMLVHDRIEVLWTDLHTNKLRTGHLAGNRFSIRVRGVKPTDVLKAKRILDELARVGVPNRIGEQRFGMMENNHAIGAALIMGEWDRAVRLLLGPDPRFPALNAESRAAFARGDFVRAFETMPSSANAERAVLRQLTKGKDARRALKALDERVVRYYVSAAQSAVFNAVLDRRIADGTWDRVVEGDVAVKRVNNAGFDVTADVAADPATAARVASHEISASGPMWGALMRRAGGAGGEGGGVGAVDALEQQCLVEQGMTLEGLSRFAAENADALTGARRALRVPLVDHAVEGGVDEHGPFVRCVFELSKGSFATTVLREVMKPALDARTSSLAAPPEGEGTALESAEEWD